MDRLARDLHNHGETQHRELIMPWVAVFWIVYGVGSTLFVICLFRLGNAVASSRKELVRQEIERIRYEGSGKTAEPGPNMSYVASPSPVSDPANRLHVQRIFQLDDQHISVQAVRDGETRLINLPLGQAAGIPATDPDMSSRVEKVL